MQQTRTAITIMTNSPASCHQCVCFHFCSVCFAYYHLTDNAVHSQNRPHSCCLPAVVFSLLARPPKKRDGDDGDRTREKERGRELTRETIDPACKKNSVERGKVRQVHMAMQIGLAMGIECSTFKGSCSGICSFFSTTPHLARPPFIGY